MRPLFLSLLGPFRAVLGDQAIDKFRSNKVQALLIYLVTEAETNHRREALMALLWPGLPQKSAQLNLRQALYHLRQAIPETPRAARAASLDSTPQDEAPVPFLLSDRQTVQLNPVADVRLDVARFGQLLSQDPTPAEIAEAVELYRGDFLADFFLPDSAAFEDWATTKRAELRRQALDALETLAAFHIEEGAYDEAQAAARRALEIDDLRESAYRGLMRALARAGQRSAALAQYESCRARLQDELGVEPSAETTRLYEQIRDGELEAAGPEAGDSSGLRKIRGYELQERVGAGGFGEVYRAYQPAVGRQVAVKVILPRYANQPEFIRRFDAEARIVARLEHPHIVPLYDYWREPGGAYLVMRWLRGGDLRQSLQQGPWRPQAAAQLLEQIAGALAVAHRQGVVHRDVKPANILLDQEANAYLSDFGIAKDLLRGRGTTTTGDVTGSLAYISPEQAQGQPVTLQSDLYSLGVVTYELLTGEHPFASETPANQLIKHVTEPLPALGERRPDLPGALNAVIQRGTAKEPAERYPDALAFAAAFREALSPAQAAVAPTPDWAALELLNPYKGLRPFEEADAVVFFGREALTEHLLVRLAPTPAPALPLPGGGGAGRFLAGVGPRGSGKSSLVKAGLLPALRRGALPGSQDWFIVDMLPGLHPLDELEIGLLQIATRQPAGLMEQLQRDERGLLRAARLVLPTRDSELLLVIDQFEELFAPGVDPAERQHLLGSLYAAVSDPRSRVRVIITLRADFYDRPLLHPAFSQLMRQHTVVVVPLSAEELAAAVREPAQQVGAELEPGLVAAIVADVSEQPGALPMLQYALTELFERREGWVLTREAYQAIGGVSGALARRAEEIYAGLDTDGQDAARQLFLRLVTLGEGVEDTRRRVLRAELEALTKEDRRTTHAVDGANHSSLALRPLSAMDQVIDTFGKARLLTFDRDPATRAPTVEVAHEALLREWGRLREWLDEGRADVRVQRLLASAASEWVGAERDAGFLLRESRLDQFEGWAAGSAVALTDDEQAYLDASVSARRARRAEEGARRQRTIFALAGGLVVALILALLAGLQWRRADQERQATERQREVALEAQATAEAERDRADDQAQLAFSRQLAAQALTHLDDQLDLASLLSVEAYRSADTFEARDSLLTALTHTPRLVAFLRGHTGPARSVAFSPACVSPTGETAGRCLGTLATGGCADLNTLTGACKQGEIVLWDLTTGAVRDRLVGDASYVSNLAFSPDGQTLASSSRGRSIILWDLATGQRLAPPLTHETALVDVTFFPDGQTLAAVGGDGAIVTWDLSRVGANPNPVATGERLDPAAGMTIDDPSTISSSVFSPDGKTLALSICTERSRILLEGCQHEEILLWDVATGQLLGPALTGHDGDVFSLAFSPDGRTLASGGKDGTATLWDVASDSPSSGQPLGPPLTHHGGWVLSLAFSPDGRTLASGVCVDPTASDGGVLILCTGGEIRLWDVATGEAKRILDLPDGRLAGLQNSVSKVAFSADGRELASVSEDGAIMLWDVADRSTSGQLGYFFPEHPADVDLVAFSPDGQKLAAVNCEETTATGFVVLCERVAVRLWHPPTGRLLDQLQVDDLVSGYAYNWDDQTFAVGSCDTQDCKQPDIRVWDVTTRQPVGSPLASQGGRVKGMAFSPDGETLASGSADGTISLWDTATIHLSAEDIAGHPPGATLSGHSGTVNHLAWSADGALLASGSSDGTIILWDVVTRQPHGPPLDGQGTVSSLAFSPDAQTLASGYQDGFIILWDVATGQPLDLPFGAFDLGPVTALAISPDGKTLAVRSLIPTGSGITLWDVETGQLLGPPLAGYTGYVRSLAFSPDGQTLASGSHGVRNDTIMLWDVGFASWQARACRRANRNLTQAEWKQFFGDQPYRKTCPDLP